MASRLQDVLLRGTAAARPLATAVANGTVYYSTDTHTTDQSDGLVWATYADSGGVPGLHAPTHEPGGTDPLTVDAVAATGSLRTLGTGATQAASGTDPRFTDARTPTAHATSHSSGGTDPVTVTNLAGYPGGGTTFLRDDHTFAVPAGTATGTVTHTAGALAAGQLVVGNASADLKVVAATNGQIPIGKSSDGSVTLAALTAGANITITNAAGAVTIAAASGGAGASVAQFGVTVDGASTVITAGTKGFITIPYACTLTTITLLSTDNAVTAGTLTMDIWKAAYASYPPLVANTIINTGAGGVKPNLSGPGSKYQDATLAHYTTAFAAGDVLAFHVDATPTLVTRVTLILQVSIP